MKQQHKTLGKIRIWMSLFIFLLILSGITAFPVRTELSWICSWWPEHNSGFYWLDSKMLAGDQSD